MAEQKTKPTEQPVESFLGNIDDERIRDDCYALIKIMKRVTGLAPKMWGPSIIGFGKYHYKYESGHEGDSCLAAFSPRKQNISVYVMPSFPGHADLLKKLGKHKMAKACLYIKKLEDVDQGVLEKIIAQSVKYVQKQYPDKVK